MRADDVLDQIDHALGGYSLSPDAMRWSPEPPPVPGTRLERTVVVTIDTTAITEQFEQLRRNLQAFGEAAQARFEEIGRAFEAMKQAGVCDDHGRRLPPRDRPAWQSRYGPAHQRRR
ncbi:hypothetical protein OG864_45200 [Streptomyces sp. NBC_00124]|uniref:hypothetical protein n=1 Tax=Streptomyces sp. NBC_00124 TaxID=2975662 RepID=UPI0022516D53|nr:hypothetical protein [Streptomyces sp. NBC_00124]MCX5365900.1 hypothetical protein [Streptomyces sp. NBC_00124]